MGLFSRRDTTGEELAAMRSALDELRAELTARTGAIESIENNDAALRAQLAEARAEQERLAHLVAGLRADHTATSDGLTEVRTQLAPALDELDARLRSMQQRLDTPMSPPPPEPPPGPETNESADVQSITTQLARLDERLAAVDRRVTSVSTELANQLAEMSSDIEALDRAAEEAARNAAERAERDSDDDDTPTADTPQVPAIDPELLEELRDAQARLANEQARYQIAFRDDLARLAEQLKRR